MGIITFIRGLVADIRVDRENEKQRALLRQAAKIGRFKSINKAYDSGVLSLLEYLTAELRHKNSDKSAMFYILPSSNGSLSNGINAYILWDISSGPVCHAFNSIEKSWQTRQIRLSITDKIIVTFISSPGCSSRHKEISLDDTTSLADIEKEIRESMAACRPHYQMNYELKYILDVDKEVNSRFITVDRLLSQE